MQFSYGPVISTASQVTSLAGYEKEIVTGSTCVASTTPGRTMRLQKEISGRTGASCFLASVLDNKKTGQSYCRECPIGKFNSFAGANCLPCPIGLYQDEKGQKHCKQCPVNQFKFETGAASCDTCEPGRYQDEKEQPAAKYAKLEPINLSQTNVHVPNAPLAQKLQEILNMQKPPKLLSTI